MAIDDSPDLALCRRAERLHLADRFQKLPAHGVIVCRILGPFVQDGILRPFRRRHGGDFRIHLERRYVESGDAVLDVFFGSTKKHRPSDTFELAQLLGDLFRSFHAPCNGRTRIVEQQQQHRGEIVGEVARAMRLALRDFFVHHRRRRETPAAGRVGLTGVPKRFPVHAFESVRLVEHDSPPCRAHDAIFAVSMLWISETPVRAQHDVVQRKRIRMHVTRRPWGDVARVHDQRRFAEPLSHVFFPLRHQPGRNADQRSLGIRFHHREHLHGFAETDFVGEDAAAKLAAAEFPFEHPPNAFSLIRKEVEIFQQCDCVVDL